MSQKWIKATYYRGGTSKGVFFQKKDLPTSDQNKLNELFLKVIGSPDTNQRQLNGMGGGVSSVSKCVIISPSERDDADIDYNFIQIAIDKPIAEWNNNCGNLSGAVGPYAVQEGIIKPKEGENLVRIYQVNTDKIIHSTFQVKDGKPSLYRANDLSKDQSYFLFATTFEQLSYLRFPLGDFTKSTIRDLAKYFDLNVAEKPDSQDICFVPDGKYSNLVRKLRPESVQKGDIYHVDGSYLGEHNGIIDYTIGQRKGIRIGGRKDVTENDAKLYVISIDEKNNKIVVGPKRYLSCDEFSINECNWITDSDKNKFDALVKLRNTAKPVQVKIQTDLEKSSASVMLKNPEFGISPGQAAVFYDLVDKNRVLGGGWIKSTKNYLND